MKAKTELLLYYLLFGVDKSLRPSPRNLTASFEEWAYGNGFWRTIADLEHRGLIEKKPSAAAERIYRLTEAGRLESIGGREPETQWRRNWDSKWRLVLFDMPQAAHVARTRLTRFLRQRWFGRLQDSVWITPDPLTPLIQQISAFGQDVGSLITLDAQPSSAEPNETIVSSAWDFEQINSRYQECIELLKKCPARPGNNIANRERVRRWAETEHASWAAAITADPFLPDALLPADYLGKKAWELRKRTLGEMIT